MSVQAFIERPSLIDPSHHFEESDGRKQEAKAKRQLPPAQGLYRRVFKRLFDIVLVVASAPITLPVTLMLAALVALDGHSSFYGQKRVGRGGRIFRMWKLRTMVPDADAYLKRYLAENPAARAEWDASQKLKCDPRITRIGRILRKTSLDELPQLWNVLIGDMSIVGPRPIMVDQQAIYPASAYSRHRPGITGLWQVSERNESTFAERAIFDNRYDAMLSLKTDVAIILRTVAVVIRGTGY